MTRVHSVHDHSSVGLVSSVGIAGERVARERVAAERVAADGPGPRAEGNGSSD